MKWEDLTVQQFQQLNELHEAADEGDAVLIAIDMACICFNRTLRQIGSMPVTELNKLASELSFFSEPIPEWSPATHVTINGTRYRFVYDVRQIRCARNIEVKHFGSKGIIQNLHSMAASMVVPQRKNWLGRWVDDIYDAANHEKYANDMKQAPVTAIYGSALFFCELLRQSIPVIADYLRSNLEMETTTKSQAIDLFLNSWSYLDGNTRSTKSPNLKESNLQEPTISHTSNS